MGNVALILEKKHLEQDSFSFIYHSIERIKIGVNAGHTIFMFRKPRIDHISMHIMDNPFVSIYLYIYIYISIKIDRSIASTMAYVPSSRRRCFSSCSAASDARELVSAAC